MIFPIRGWNSNAAINQNERPPPRIDSDNAVD